MQVLWAARGPVTARSVADALTDRGLAYTTWLTVLARLEAKGLVRRSRDERAHSYVAVESREDVVAGLMQQALGQTDDREAALQRFVRSVSIDEAEALRRALDDLPDATG